MDDAAKAKAQQNRQWEEEQKERLEQLRSLGDYPNDAIFRNLALNKLNPGSLNQLASEIGKLQMVENEAWREKLTEALRGKEMKDLRKKIKDKDWFPKDWLPQ